MSGSMGFMITLSALLIVGAVAGVVAQRRAQRSRPSVSGRSGRSGRSGLSGLDAEANHWLVRLGAGLVPPDVRAWAGADEAAGRSLTRAAECHREARTRLAAAHTAAEYAQVTRVAKEGLEHLRTARTALGPASAADGGAGAEPGTVGVLLAVTTR
ncbi:hypothetical protein [Streptomyces sp. ME18-1-4]|uniref:hypothetical protein n=1 Tax=Streptomyces sp. ME18-1-4 TaxID=3028685 RepID=UPI0029B849A6|nr:hypothetical protein [Streptomyces sp. ME18-1-4]MDX3247306.1 hypothetical protein [Streptomyces sp. ME18-1-4]